MTQTIITEQIHSEVIFGGDSIGRHIDVHVYYGKSKGLPRPSQGRKYLLGEQGTLSLKKPHSPSSLSIHMNSHAPSL